MTGYTNWSDDEFDYNRREIRVVPHSYLELIEKDEGSSNKFESIVSVLPDDLQERILADLPIASALNVRSVCKKWNDIVRTKRFMTNISRNYFTDKPWYFMFTSYDDPSGHVYDPVLRTWYPFELPCSITSSWYVASSNGLTCVMDNDSTIEPSVCNPITKECKKLEPLGLNLVDYNALAFSVDNSLYKVAVIRSKQVSGGHPFRWNISINIYCSETMTWLSPVAETLSGWRGGDVSVICNGVLYLMVYYTGEMYRTQNLHGLLAYKFGKELDNTIIEVPCFLTCGRLMDMKGKLVMVGGIGRRDRIGVIRGIRIWILEGGTRWELVSKMPHEFFQGFGEFDDVFASSGRGDLIYIQTFGGTTLLVFDMNSKKWSWAKKRCPVSKKFTVQIFTGFCFEPRLESLP